MFLKLTIEIIDYWIGNILRRNCFLGHAIETKDKKERKDGDEDVIS